VSAGLGTLGSSVGVDSAVESDFSASGLGYALDVLVGGTPTPGIAVGGGLFLARASSGETSFDDVEVQEDSQLGFALAGAFVDGFPDRNGGFHLGGAAGPALVSFDVGDGSGNDHEGFGFGAALWLGFGAWVAPDWSIGGKLQLAAAFTGDGSNDADQQARTTSLMLLLSALYH
jgi:hypothetical protein